MRRRRALGSLLGIATTLAALGVMWRSSDLGHASAGLEAQRAAAKREGVPLEWSDLRRLEPLDPKSDNAAPLYTEAIAEFHLAGGLNRLPRRFLDAVVEGKAKPDDLARARAELKANARGLALFVAGSERPRLAFDRPWEQGVRLLFPEFSDELGAARALVLRAILVDGTADAARDLRAAARIATHAGSEPFLISPLVGASAERDVEKGIRAVGRRGGAWTQAARSALDAFGPLPNPRRFLAGEAVMERHLGNDLEKESLSELMSLSTGTGDEHAIPFAIRFAKLKIVREAFEARTIEYWRKVYAALPSDPLDWRRTAKATQIPYPQGMSGAMVALFTPSLEGVGDLVARMETERRLTHAALDLQAGDHAALPADPFGNGPLKTRREGKGWTVWSVGPDGVDQNGKAKDRDDDSAYDLVVTS